MAENYTALTQGLVSVLDTGGGAWDTRKRNVQYALPVLDCLRPPHS